MRNVIITLLIILFGFNTPMQDEEVHFVKCGVYKTYDDYINGNIIEYESLSINMRFGKYSLVFTDKNAREVTYESNPEVLWGFLSPNRRTYRIGGKNHPYVIVELGKLVVYFNSSTTFYGNKVSYESNSHQPMISLGANGQMVKLIKRNIKTLIVDEKSAIKKLDDSRSNLNSLVNFVKEYNEVYRKKKANEFNEDDD